MLTSIVILAHQPSDNPFFVGLLFLFFNWRKIALQCCVGFCHMTVGISHNYTCIRSLLSLAPLPHPTPLGYHRVTGWAPCIIF